MTTFKRNLLLAPVVLLIRAPILLLLITLIRLGEAAERAEDWVSSAIPGFEREPRP